MEKRNIAILGIGATVCMWIAFQLIDVRVPMLVEPEHVQDITLIEDPLHAQRFYGSFTGNPHMFEIRLTEPQVITLQLFAPNTIEAKDNIAGIIVKETSRGRRVEEIARLRKEQGWETDFDAVSGDTYRVGAFFEKELTPGTYHFEVHTADNLEQYVFTIGNRKNITIGYFEFIGRLMNVKEFFGKAKIRVVESPYVYIPLFVYGALFFVYYRERKREEEGEGTSH